MPRLGVRRPDFATERKLGNLVQFERRKEPETDRPAAAAEAEILIFTGVRYERQTDAAPTKPTASSGGKRKRG